MGLPQPPETRRFYRAAKQRFDDAQLLLRLAGESEAEEGTDEDAGPTGKEKKDG